MENENLVVITITEAKLRKRAIHDVLVSYQVDEILKGTAINTGDFTMPLNEQDWPTRVHVSERYVVPVQNGKVFWGVCSASSNQYEEGTVYGIRKLENPYTNKNERCDLKLLRQKAIRQKGHVSPEEIIELFKMSVEELNASLDAGNANEAP